jgi:hypothetical protein
MFIELSSFVGGQRTVLSLEVRSGGDEKKKRHDCRYHAVNGERMDESKRNEHEVNRSRLVTAAAWDGT